MQFQYFHQLISVSCSGVKQRMPHQPDLFHLLVKLCFSSSSTILAVSRMRFLCSPDSRVSHAALAPWKLGGRVDRIRSSICSSDTGAPTLLNSSAICFIVLMCADTLCSGFMMYWKNFAVNWFELAAATCACSWLSHFHMSAASTDPPTDVWYSGSRLP